ncbi:hypothetical protein DXG01_015302 [Tephrocybe rancida]|nr:hypothetical protein DXG01_015302 [Tephrocybe rancida]
MPVNPLEPNAHLYEAMDLIALSRNELVNLVKKQLSKWPIHLKFNAKTNMQTLRLALVDPYNGFTTTKPHKPAGFDQRGTVPNAPPPPPVKSPHASVTMNPAEPPPYATGTSGFLAVEDSDIQQMGMWIMRLRELIVKIHESNCVKVGVADFTRPEYTQIFIKAPILQLAIMTPDPVYIAMPASANPSHHSHFRRQCYAHGPSALFSRLHNIT